VSLSNTFWVFVNDGSTDNTQDIIDNLKKNNIKSIKMLKNRGKSEAIRAGVLWSSKNLLSEYESLGYIDSDGAFAISDVERLNKIFHEKQKVSNDISIWSSRVALSGREINRTPFRHILGRIVSLVVSSGSNNIAYDTQCGFKYFSFNRNTLNLFQAEFKTRWFIDIEIYVRYALADKKRMKIWEEPLMFWDEIQGSKINSKQIYVLIKELMVIKIMQNKIRKVL